MYTNKKEVKEFLKREKDRVARSWERLERYQALADQLPPEDKMNIQEKLDSWKEIIINMEMVVLEMEATAYSHEFKS